ncbi:MAG TPA: sugar phosphate isomerase/epimerase [Euryarchaeota archaeon]|nr:sugar phosphate isomerase/epimerase [Euryarchaeota archaeon]
MKLSLALTPQKAAFAPLLFAGDMEHGIKRAAELGYEGIELNILDPTKLDTDKLIALIHAYNMEVVALGTGQAYIEEGISLSDPDFAIRTKAVERLKNHIKLAQELDAQVVIGGIRGKFSLDESVKQVQYEGALNATHECAQFANKLGVTLTVEPINRYETNFINTVEEGVSFLQKLGITQVKLLVDTFHMNIEEKSIIESLKAAKHKLSHVHLVDSNRLAPGQGHVDFKSVIRTLQDIGYEGYLSAEILPKPDDETAARLNIMHVRKLLSEQDF